MVVSQMDNELQNAKQISSDVENITESEKSVCDLIDQLEDYVPTVPDALTMYYLNMAGFANVDDRIVRIISVTAQKFISDIANDSLQHCKSRSNSQHSGTHNANKVNHVLTIYFMQTILYLFSFMRYRIRRPSKIASTPWQLKIWHLL